MCLNFPFEVKNQLTIYKVRWFKFFLLFSIFDILRFFEALQMFFSKFLLTLSWRGSLSYRNQFIDLLRKSMDWLLYDNDLRHERVKMGKKWRKMLSPTYSLKFKTIILFLNRCLYFFSNGHFATLFRRKTQRCFNVVLRCKFQRWHTQRCFNVDLTLCDVAMSYQPKNNVEPTLQCLLGLLV